MNITFDPNNAADVAAVQKLLASLGAAAVAVTSTPAATSVAQDTAATQAPPPPPAAPTADEVMALLKQLPDPNVIGPTIEALGVTKVVTATPEQLTALKAKLVEILGS